MDISKISIGKAPPHDLNVIIEVPAGVEPIKYELDKESGALFVDRFLHTPMRYPVNYGFLPHTLANDGDPVDVLVYAESPIMAGAVVRCRPVGVLEMTDDGGEDEKILCVPVDKLHPWTRDIQTHTDLPQILLDAIEHFFSRYKDLEPGKWVKIKGWAGPDRAAELIDAGIAGAG